MVAGNALGLHALTGLGIEQQGVQLLHMATRLNELCRHDVGVCRGGREPEAAGVGCKAGVKAVCNVRRNGNAHGVDHLVQQLCRRCGAAIEQGEVGIAAVACVVVDAQVYMARELRHTVVFSKQLHAGDIHRYHRLRLKLTFEHMCVGKRIPVGNGIGAEHCHVFIQCFQCTIQRAAAANGIAIRVFVTQNQNVVRRHQALGHLLHIQLFCHSMIHPFRRRNYSSVSSGALASVSASPFTFSVRSSSLMWAA